MTETEKKMVDDCAEKIKKAVSEAVKNVVVNQQQQAWKQELKKALEKKCDGWADQKKRSTIDSVGGMK